MHQIKGGKSNKFIFFMLKMIVEVLKETVTNIREYSSNLDKYVNRLLKVMSTSLVMSTKEIMEKFHLKSKETFYRYYL